MNIQKKIEATKQQIDQVQQEVQQNNATIQQYNDRNKQLEGQYNVLVGRLNTLQEIASEGESVFFPEADPAAMAPASETKEEPVTDQIESSSQQDQ